VIDPLDGTVNFVHGVPQSCVSVAVERGGQVLAGGVYDPFRNELFMAMRGKGATMNGRKIHVSKERDISKALLVTGFPYDRFRRVDHLLAALRPFFERGIDIRRFGAAALDMAWVACGRVDAFWELGLSRWDIAAGWLLVEEAGGRVTTYANKPINFDSLKDLLSSNSSVHSALSRLLRRSNPEKS
jgi:myo-inositol-1(or 4)-monophosphatase